MRRRSTLAVLLFVGVGGVLGAGVSCTASPSKVLPLGAGVDAYPPPRYPEDASGDARRPPADAAPWTGEIPIPGEWLPIPGLPATCSVRIAKDPKVSTSRLPWQPCASGRSGCELFLADWGVDNQRRFRPSFLEGVFEDAAGVHLTYRRYLAPDTAASQVVAQLLDGEAEATWFSGSNCSLIADRSRHGFAVVVVDVVGSGTPEKTVQQFLGWSTSLDPLRFEYVQEALTPRLNISQGVARGADFLTLESTNFGGPIVASAFRFSDRQFARSTPANDLDAERPLPASGGYVSIIPSDPPSLAFMPLEGGYRTLVRPAPAYFVNDLRLDRANGDALVWTEAEFADDYRRILWTSPFANTEAGVARRRIARFDVDSYVANAGVAVGILRETRNARVVRLSDGMGWDVQSEPGLGFLWPLWINEDSVWMVISKPDPRTPSVPMFSGALRIRRSTLGPATVPNGL